MDVKVRLRRVGGVADGTDHVSGRDGISRLDGDAVIPEMREFDVHRAARDHNMVTGDVLSILLRRRQVLKTVSRATDGASGGADHRLSKDPVAVDPVRKASLGAKVELIAPTGAMRRAVRGGYGGG
jgi:hypothetical protein